MPRELTQGEITTRELDRLISEVKDDKLKSQIRETISRLELHKSYGLRFERHLPEVITHEGKTIDLGEQYFPWLRKVEQVKGKNPKGPEHLLLECDNYVALKYLQYTHQGKVDVIYIDPPYNTGNKDFRYNDKFVDSEDNFRHSKWLSFMEKRLKLAKKLLSNEGVLFVQIGDQEVGGLILLCDEIFGEKNRAGIVTRISKRTSNKGNFFAPSKDTILCYINSRRVSGFKGELSQEQIKSFNRSEGGKHYKEVGLYQSSLDPRSNQRYWIECPDGELVIPPGSIFPAVAKDGEMVKPKAQTDKVWRWSRDSYLQQKNLLVYKKTKSSPLVNQNGEPAQWNIYTKTYLDSRLESGLIPRDFIENYTNNQGTASLAQLGIKFDYSKPPELIKHLIKLCSSPNSLILDFFAGSGTTYQAVAELNEDDGGNRQCILVTNNESNICREVTWERVKRVTAGTHDYPECTKKYDGNPSAHATFYTMEIYTDDEIDQQTRGWKKNMEGYLPLVSTKFNIAHNWKKIPDTRGYYCEGTAILSTDELDYEAQSFLKKEAIDRLIIISEDKEEFELAKKRCKKTTKVSEFHFLPRNYREYFANFHTKA